MLLYQSKCYICTLTYVYYKILIINNIKYETVN
jgi:hypothetical protein